MRVLRYACDRCGKDLKDWEVEKVDVTFCNTKHHAELCSNCKDVVQAMIYEAITAYSRTQKEVSEEVLPKYVRGSLSKQQRSIAWTLYEQGKSIQDISMILNKHPNNVKACIDEKERILNTSHKFEPIENSDSINIPASMYRKRNNVEIISPSIAIVNGTRVDLEALRYRRKSGYNDDAIAHELHISKDYVKDIILAYNKYLEAVR